MSFFPLEEVKCGPLKPRKYPATVVGTPNATWGYRLLEKSNCKLFKVPESFESLDEEKRREYEHLTKILEFEGLTNRRIKKKKVWQRVQQDLLAYQDTVNVRRQKLREVLLKEEVNLIREVVDQAQHGDDARMDDMRRRTEEIHKEREEQRLSVVAAKRMQQYLAQYPEIRQKLSKISTVEAKQGNLAQMADNEAKRQAERELDHLWHDLMLKEVEAKKQREIEDAKRRCLLEKDTVDTLAKQVAGKLALEEQKKQVRKEDEKFLEELWETLREEELKKLEEERENRERLKADLQEQILLANRRLAEQARHEKEMDSLRQSIAAEELAKEQSSIKETSAALRKELLAYLGYLEELRREEARRNLEVDRIIAESTKDAEGRRDLAVQKFKEVRKRMAEDVVQGREQQLRMKCERERELAAYSKEERKNRMLSYRKDLEDQWKQAEDVRRREAEREEERRLEEKRREEEYEKLTEELLHASEDITPHPFKILLRECAARYAAEKEGLCYCPPPLSGDSN
ncbi:PREDICTED: vicilin-like seed storage protein At2g18540 [Habropoda laboriosa]|uniref:vicilin-like seed storage protein At2g18540 n=1 Tax=Habropoda laboriosa TaxID=597456 RepID=UPI00083DBF63|nr:PREDICTED: vicilin-like seed storage protein At2g18540 [Habropoda laboriosa]